MLHADIVCLNYDGNILDASLLALTTALKNCKYYGILYRREAKDPLLLLHGKVYFMQKKKRHVDTTIENAPIFHGIIVLGERGGYTKCID